MSIETVATEPEQMRFKRDGSAGELFGLVFRTTLLSFVTLGVYRFWMRTHLRRWYWSHFRFGGESFVYHGTGLEKLLGFLVAVVVLAALLGLGQLIATFAGFGLGHPMGFFATALVVLPLTPFAQYRARRYILSRTTWRGVRFGLAPGARGYVLRWLGYMTLAILSLGLLLPLAQFKLESYLTQQSYYGDLAFRQEGRWSRLWRIWALIWLGAALIMGGAITLIALAVGEGGAPDTARLALAQAIMALGLPLLMLIYQVRAYNYLNSNKATENGVRFSAEVKVRRVMLVLATFAVKSILLYIALSIVAVLIILVVAGGLSSLPDPQAMMAQDGAWLALAIIPAAVVALALLAGFMQAALTLPLIACYLEAVTAHDAARLLNARQRARETAGAADGFADALDVDIGGAF